MTQNNAKLVFWGVRGSTPTVERDTWRYGGNTPCLEFTAPSDTHFILDCGTGLRMLGNHLQTRHNRWSRWRGDGGMEAHVLVTHRSEERRVGKEGRSRGSADTEKKKVEEMM